MKRYGFNKCLFIISLVCMLLIDVANDTYLWNDTNMSSKRIISVDFEVYGRVQGVFFRKYTRQEAKKLNLKGWCMNTERGTMQGVIQGESNNIENMKQWLQTTGSPSSQIQRAEFKNEVDIKKITFSNFDIKR